jgi:hypothetical protein
MRRTGPTADTAVPLDKRTCTDIVVDVKRSRGAERSKECFVLSVFATDGVGGLKSYVRMDVVPFVFRHRTVAGRDPGTDVQVHWRFHPVSLRLDLVRVNPAIDPCCSTAGFSRTVNN